MLVILTKYRAHRFDKNMPDGFKKQRNVRFEGDRLRIADPQAVFVLQNIFFVVFVGVFLAHDLIEADVFQRAVVGHTRAHLKNHLLVLVVVIGVAQQLGTGPDKTHVSVQHVDNLRQTRQMGPVQERSPFHICGFSMAQIGEFSFIIASLGLSLGVISNFLYPVVVAVSVITTFLTPYMIKLANPSYDFLEKRIPNKWVRSLNHLAMSHPNTTEKSKWKKLLLQMGRNTLIYSILSAATIALMFTFALPFFQRLLPGEHLQLYVRIITGVLTVLLIAPFLRAMVMKKNHSDEFMALWKESNVNRIPLMFTILVRLVIAVAFIFYICNYLTHFSRALMITIGIVAVLFIILSRWIKRRSIRLERLFILNLRSRDIEAQVHGHKRPLYEGKLLDRNIHIADFEIPADSLWMGKTLKELNLGKKYGVHVSSILRANRRLNIPDGNSMVFPGDKLQVIGSDEQLTAFRHAIESELLGEDLELEKREMRLRSIIISGSSPFVGKTLQESGIRDKFNCMVVGIEEGEENLSQPQPSYRFEKDDIIWVVGEEEALLHLTS